MKDEQKEKIRNLLPIVRKIMPEVLKKSIMTGTMEDPVKLIVRAMVKEIENERKEKRL